MTAITFAAYAASRKARGLPGGKVDSVISAADSGRIPTIGGRLIDPDAADAAWEANTDPGKVPGSANGTRPGAKATDNPESLNSAKVAREKVRTELDRVLLEERRGALIPFSDVNAREEALGRALRDRLGPIGTRIAAEFGADDEERSRLRDRIDEEVNVALEALAAWANPSE